MAKSSDSGFLERHIEKFVLGVAVLILGVMVYQNVLSSGAGYKVIAAAGRGTETVAPDKMDATIRQGAQNLMEIAEHAKYTPKPPLSDALEVMMQAPLPASVTSVLPMGIPMPAEGAAAPRGTAVVATTSTKPPESMPAGKATLAQVAAAMPAPEAPRLSVDAELVQKSKERLDEHIVAHVASAYPWSELKAKWTALLGPSLPARPVYYVAIGVEAQVQEQLPDGTWGSARAVTPVSKPQVDAKGNPAEPLRVPDYNGQNSDQVRAAVEAGALAIMQEAIQPDFWPILVRPHGWVNWQVHLPHVEMGDADAAHDGDDRPAPPPAAGKKAPPRPQPPADQQGAIPPLAAQLDKGRVALWLHDVALNNDRAYRYRLRLVMLNPLYGQDGELAGAGEAAQMAVASPWSQWSEKDASPRETEVFATGSSPNLRNVSFTVFSRKAGQWVMATFAVGLAQAIGGDMKVDLVDPGSGGAMQLPHSFKSGCTLVWVDFDRRIYRGLGDASSPATEAVFVDSSGKLHTRVVELDKGSRRLQELRDACSGVPASGKPARPPG
jgi:hypothetical protein